MTYIHDTTTTESFSKEVSQYIEANLHILQQKRLDTLNNATLEDVFKNRNPYLLRATVSDAISLLDRCMERYIASADERIFDNFLLGVAACTAQISDESVSRIDGDNRRLYRRESWESVSGSPTLYLEILRAFSPEKLPLRTELLEARDRSLHRLLLQFYQLLCNEDATVDWERLTEFISECDTEESFCDVGERIDSRP
ncbi:MAG: PmeII family type II restriction endonuclease [Chloroflexi bacterium]|nr:PmeII family type II restriction endonuclease [Chloroflexota bacterium]